MRPSALLDLVNIVQVELDLRNATGAQNLLSKFTQPNRAQYRLKDVGIIRTNPPFCQCSASLNGIQPSESGSFMAYFVDGIDIDHRFFIGMSFLDFFKHMLKNFF